MSKFFQYTSFIVFLGCFLTIGNLVTTAWGQTIHVILAADGADESVGSTVKLDLDKMKALFQANVPAANLNLIVLDAEDLTADKMLQAVDNLSVASNDTVVFYYSGHGAFDTSNEKQFFQLTKQPNLYRDTLLTRIEGKKPRLSVLLSDCCNTAVADAGAGARTAGISVAPRNPIATSFSPLFASLFLDCKGTVDMTSSKPGEDSVALRARGSIFTLALDQVVLHNRTSPDMYWNEFYDKLRSGSQAVFSASLPDGLLKGPGAPRQMTQTVHKYRLPGTDLEGNVTSEPNNEGPRLGLRAVNHDGVGVRVTAIAPNSPASKADIAVGDIITNINGGTVKDESNYSDAVDASPKTMTLILQKADGTNKTVSIELGR